MGEVTLNLTTHQPCTFYTRRHTKRGSGHGWGAHKSHATSESRPSISGLTAAGRGGAKLKIEVWVTIRWNTRFGCIDEFHLF